MTVEKINDHLMVVTDVWKDSVAFRFDGGGDLVIFRCNPAGQPLKVGDDKTAHVAVDRNDMHTVLEHYRKTL